MRLILELDTDAEPVTGSLIDDRGICRTFVGLLELLSLVETLRAPRPGPGRE